MNNMAKRRRKLKEAQKDGGKRKLKVIITNLILFIVLFLASCFLWNVSTNVFYNNLFLLLSMILGFVAVAFFISLLVVLIAKAIIVKGARK
jgi:membrane-associated HD superfamily phosphohydrolase